MIHALLFRLKVPGTDEFRGLRAVSTSYRFRGVLRLEGFVLTIEWGGLAQVQQVGALTIRDDHLTLPDEGITVPVSHLYRATLAGGWWRPRLTLQAKVLGALAMVPSEELGAVQFWYARGDRTAAIAMTAALNTAMAAAPPAAIPPPAASQIGDGPSTPPGGLTSG
jgi:hypothetical protein